MQLLHTMIGNGRRAAFGSSKSTGYADSRDVQQVIADAQAAPRQWKFNIRASGDRQTTLPGMGEQSDLVYVIGQSGLP
jgi:hypothetical protein